MSDTAGSTANSTLIFEQFYLDCLSHASYLVGDRTSGTAVVVDPQRDIQQYLDSARGHGLTITHVFETHFHADFLSGHLELARATGADVCFGSAARPQFPARLFSDGERLSLGSVVLEVRHTPGHTPESISIVVWESESDARSGMTSGTTTGVTSGMTSGIAHSAVPYGVLTGDTLFIGDVGRPDLLVSVGKSADELGHMLFASLKNKIMTLPDPTRVFPAHGAGSACGKNLSTEKWSTIGQQRTENYALQFDDADTFVAAVTEGQPDAPGYFIYDAVRNQQDRDVLAEHEAPARFTLTQLLDARDSGIQIVDTRDNTLFATGHLVGSVNVGLGGRYAEYAGSVINPDEDIVIVTDSGQELEAKIRLARIGYDRVTGWFPVEDLADVPGEVARASRMTASEFLDRRAGIAGLQLIDVRGVGEQESGMLDGAVSVPVAQLRRRSGELDASRPTVVYCAGGYRSSVAASVLRNLGFRDVSDIIGGIEAVKLVLG